MAKHTEEKDIRSLKMNPDVNVNGMTIEVVKNSTNVGLGSLAKIDYLKTVHHYTVLFVNKLSRISGKKRRTKEEVEDKPLNLAKMTKQVMRQYKNG